MLNHSYRQRSESRTTIEFHSSTATCNESDGRKEPYYRLRHSTASPEMKNKSISQVPAF